MSEPWSRGDKIAVTGVLVAVVVGFVNIPKVRLSFAGGGHESNPAGTLPSQVAPPPNVLSSPKNSQSRTRTNEKAAMMSTPPQTDTSSSSRESAPPVSGGTTTITLPAGRSMVWDVSNRNWGYHPDIWFDSHGNRMSPRYVALGYRKGEVEPIATDDLSNHSEATSGDYPLGKIRFVSRCVTDMQIEISNNAKAGSREAGSLPVLEGASQSEPDVTTIGQVEDVTTTEPCALEFRLRSDSGHITVCATAATIITSMYTGSFYRAAIINGDVVRAEGVQNGVSFYARTIELQSPRR